VTYNPQHIEIKENKKSKYIDEEVQINGLYETIEDAKMYSKADDSTAFDSLDKGSIVTILEEAEKGFVRVDYNGNQAYVKVSLLKGI
jgi:hypothetical protein